MGDDRSYHDRDKKSFSERDRARREGRGDAPRGPRAAEAEKRATQEALSQADALFSSGKVAERKKLGAALLEARGTPGLADACRAYRDVVGPPNEPRHVSCFLDCEAPDVLLAGLEGLGVGLRAGEMELSAGLRTQLRMLANHADDAVADEAEFLLEGP